MESTLKYKVSWVGTEPIETGVKVKSSAKSVKKKRQPPVTIDYSMSPAGEEWKVFDIFTDDVSLVKNYKRQFRRVIADEGWNGLIDRMEKKLHADDELI
jgi:phospholipid transport system substrate-binding protein